MGRPRKKEPNLSKELQRLQGLLYQAINSRVGLLLTTNDINRAIQNLHKARRAAADPILNSLSFHVNEEKWGDGTIAVVRTNKRTEI